MNDPSKRIDVNLSSLLSLKAELLRKQDEVNKAKIKQTTNPFVPKKAKDIDKIEEEDVNNDKKVKQKYEEYEDSGLLEKSRRILEAKSKFYDKMASSGGQLNSDDNCLVMFNHKKQSENPYNLSKNSHSSEDSDDSDRGKQNSPKSADEEWVEYTDCLGRSRKCLRKDLDFFKNKDTKLAENIQPRELNQNAPLWMIDTKGSESIGEIPDDVSDIGTSIMSKHDQMKLNWEKKEQENIYKEDVHYQDVLFDEARQHGVGYYGFSTDDAERAKQRKALDEVREKTLTYQKEKETQRNQRDQIIAERVRAAKNRQRARLGLPPIQDGEENTGEDDAETAIMKKENEKLRKREEKLKRRKEMDEKKRSEERSKHVRPWDRNKDGVSSNRRQNSNSSSSESDEEWSYKPERLPMSQEEWNEKQRELRNPNFAPPPPVKVPELRPFTAVPPPQHLSQFVPHQQYENEHEYEQKNPFYFSSKKPERPKEFLKRNYSASTSTEIINELEEESFHAAKQDSVKRSRGVEIPPPPTFEYYGPTNAARHSMKRPQKPQLEESIEAGLKFLRNQSDKGVLPSKSNWSSNADY